MNVSKANKSHRNLIGSNSLINLLNVLKLPFFSGENYFERNTFIDIILNDIYAHAGTRRIVFSSFDPDMCTLIALKQHKYPVLFLSVGETQRYVPFVDERTCTSRMAVNFAISQDILVRKLIKLIYTEL